MDPTSQQLRVRATRFLAFAKQIILVANQNPTRIRLPYFVDSHNFGFTHKQTKKGKKFTDSPCSVFTLQTSTCAFLFMYFCF